MKSDNLRNELGSLLSKTQWRLRNYFQKRLTEASIDITVEQWSVLAAINSRAVTQTEISKRIEKDKTNVTRMIDLLEKKNLVERTPIPEDRRGYHIRITEKGQKTISQIIPIVHEVNTLGMEGFSDEEKRVFLEALNKIRTNFEAD